MESRDEKGSDRGDMERELERDRGSESEG